MENYNQPPSGRDPELWEIAKRRASFKTHLVTYIVINCFLWALWLFTDDGRNFTTNKIPWPAWSTLGWGIGLAFHFLGAYVFPKENSVEKE
jgi:2TM domain